MIDLQRTPAVYQEDLESPVGTAWPIARTDRRHADAVPRAYSWATIFLVTCDVAAAFLGLWMAHYAFTTEAALGRFWVAHWQAALALPLVTVGSHYYFDTYRAEILFSRSRAVARSIKATAIGGALFLIAVALLARDGAPRVETLCALGIAAVGTVLARAVVRDLIGFAVRRVLIIGAGPAGQDLAAVLEEHPEYRLCGFLDDLAGERPWPGCGPVVGSPDSVGPLVAENGADLVVIAEEVPLTPSTQRALRRLEFQNVGLMSMPDLYELLTGRVATWHLGERWYTALGYLKPDPLLLSVKRGCDTLLAGLLIMLASPLMVAIAALIRLTSPGGALYSQERVGLRGASFRLWKFRSMFQDAEQRSGPVWASKNDPRVTPLGRILRRSRLDELPQLWNVLRGDMSLTGPRPERPMFVSRFAESIPFYEKRLAVRPGLTGWAQVMHRYDESEEDVATKLQYDLYYIKHWSLLLDLQIWIKTIATVLTGSGAR